MIVVTFSGIAAKIHHDHENQTDSRGFWLRCWGW
jgi:hypothetical protein